MSRVASRAGAPAATRRDNEIDDVCPVCKSSRYLNPNMEFRVNPECYHKMCQSCVDRIFRGGPAQCPIAGCRKILRQNRFRKQTFDDIQIEREVDIRRRVAEVFNLREDDFDTLLSYNDYLEKAESITFELANNIDVAGNERRLAGFREENAKIIKRNAALAHEQSASFKVKTAAEKEQARARREAARREEEQERQQLQEQRRRIIDSIATSQGNASQILHEGEIKLKRSLARTTMPVRKAPDAHLSKGDLSNGNANSDGFYIAGIKKRTVVEVEPEAPYDPFGGLSYKPEYHNLRDYYEWDHLKMARTDPQILAGGYDLHSYCQRALSDAFSGLGVFVEEDKSSKRSGSDMVNTSAAALAAGSSSDDVF